MVQDARTVLLTAVATVQQHVPALAKAHRNRMDVQTVVVHASLLALAVVKIVRRVPGVQDVHLHALTHVRMSVVPLVLVDVQEIVLENVQTDALAAVSHLVKENVKVNVRMPVQNHVLTIVKTDAKMDVKQVARQHAL